MEAMILSQSYYDSLELRMVEASDCGSIVIVNAIGVSVEFQWLCAINMGLGVVYM